MSCSSWQLAPRADRIRKEPFPCHVTGFACRCNSIEAEGPNGIQTPALLLLLLLLVKWQLRPACCRQAEHVKKNAGAQAALENVPVLILTEPPGDEIAFFFFFAALPAVKSMETNEAASLRLLNLTEDTQDSSLALSLALSSSLEQEPTRRSRFLVVAWFRHSGGGETLACSSETEA